MTAKRYDMSVDWILRFLKGNMGVEKPGKIYSEFFNCWFVKSWQSGDVVGDKMDTHVFAFLVHDTFVIETENVFQENRWFQ